MHKVHMSKALMRLPWLIDAMDNNCHPVAGGLGVANSNTGGKGVNGPRPHTLNLGNAPSMVTHSLSI